MDGLDQLLVSGNEIGAAQQRQRGATPQPGSAPSGVRKTAVNLRKTYAGMLAQAIAAGITTDVKCDVLEAFRMDRMYLSAAAQALLVGNIRVGTKPLNISPNPISGNVFSEQAIGNEMSGYTAQPGTGITVTFTNSTVASITTGGGFLGWAAL